MIAKHLRTARRLLVGVLLLFGVALPDAHAQEEAGELTVTEVQLASTLERGRAVAPTTAFTHADGRIYAVVRLSNPSREATSIRVSIEPVGGSSRRGVSLEVPARRRYRTVARMSAAQRPGRYRVVVRAEDGRELSSVELTVSE